MWSESSPLYESRIADLEGQLAVKEEENRELMRTNFQLAKKALEVESNPQPCPREPKRCWVFAARVAPARSTATPRRTVPIG